MRDNRGFTLIELLIVVVIIGILAAIAIPKFSSTREKAYFAALKSDLKNLASQEEIYHSDNFTYSTVATTLGFVASSGSTMVISEGTATGWAGTATHAALASGEGCSLYYGVVTTVPTIGSPSAAGEVACTS